MNIQYLPVDREYDAKYFKDFKVGDVLQWGVTGYDSPEKSWANSYTCGIKLSENSWFDLLKMRIHTADPQDLAWGVTIEEIKLKPKLV